VDPTCEDNFALQVRNGRETGIQAKGRQAEEEARRSRRARKSKEGKEGKEWQGGARRERQGREVNNFFLNFSQMVCDEGHYEILKLMLEKNPEHCADSVSFGKLLFS
jgi:hypothetical protein